MKSVLISIQPKWVEKIASGEKTIEVRKNRPKLETPFKCYIYCTQTKRKEERLILQPFGYALGGLESNFTYMVDGKVIGEFVCDRIEDFYCASVPYQKENNLGYGHFVDNGVYKVNGWHEGVVFERNDRYIDSMLKNKELKEMCLSAQEIFDYIGIGKHLYGWHISDLKIYDKPKELSEFYSAKWDMTCEHKKRGFNMDFCMAYENGSHFCKELNCDKKRLTRPPQSYCYIESLGE